jgi:hypothetical protein
VAAAHAVSDEVEEEEFEVEEGLAESLEHKSRLQLVELLEEVVKDPDVNVIKNQVTLIKVAYLKCTMMKKRRCSSSPLLKKNRRVLKYRPAGRKIQERFQHI